MATITCAGKQHTAEIRDEQRYPIGVTLGEATINGVVWICRRNNDGTWKAVARKAVSIGRR
jgi:hypothetical protein